MSILPIPPEIYFSDFAFDLKCYSVIRNGKVDFDTFDGQKALLKAFIIQKI